MTGMQGIGCKTPNADAVAAETCGFARDEHMPKGMIFFMGIKSIIVAIGGPPESTLFSGVTMSTEGVIPKLQAHVAPAHTQKAIFLQILHKILL